MVTKTSDEYLRMYTYNSDLYNDISKSLWRIAIVPDWDIVINYFKFQSHYVPFQTYTRGKGMNPIYLQIVPFFFFENGFGIK